MRRLFQRTSRGPDGRRHHDGRAARITPEAVRAIARLLRQEGSEDSRLRVLCIVLCYQAAGRASETAWKSNLQPDFNVRVL